LTPAGARWVEVRSVQDEETRAGLEAEVAARVDHDRRNHGGVSVLLPRHPRRLLCGCVEPAVGPSQVDGDGCCLACSP